MIYEYHCPKCELNFDIVKEVKDMTREEVCECGTVSVRQFVPRRVFFSGTSVQNAEYNHGLGQVIHNKQHREEVAKRKGLVEVGNDFKTGSNLQNHYDTAREEKLNKGWDDL